MDGDERLLAAGYLKIPGNGQRDALPPDVFPEGIHVSRSLAIGCGVLRVGVGPGHAKDETLDVLRHSKLVVPIGEEAVVTAGASPIAAVGEAPAVTTASSPIGTTSLE